MRNSNTVITFTGEVKGTPPRVDDPYRISLEGFASGNMPLIMKTTSSSGEQFSAATAEWQLTNITVDMKELSATANSL